MLLIKIDKIKKYYADRLILDIDSLEIFAGEKIGLVGANGGGKTTLLNIICGVVEADEGNIHINNNFSYITQLEEAVDIEIGKISKELKIPNEYNSYLSGGEKVKARIAKALNENKELIIADEPTSNLDGKSIKYIEEKFKEYQGAVLLVSHDREFLDNICTKIFELEGGKVTVYDGNYSSYLIQKDERINRAEFEYDQYVKEKRRLEEAIKAKSSLRDSVRKAPTRFGNSEARLCKMGDQKAKKSMENAIKGIVSRIDRLEEKEKPKKEQIIKVDIAEGHEFYAKYPIDINEITLEFEEKVLIKKASFKLKKNKKVALIGENGCGKTTLINAILDKNKNIKIANRVKIGYFKQGLDILDQNKTILENVMEDSSFNQTFIRITLARFLFKEDSVYKKVSVLSGGEKVRVSLCKIILSDNNLLILDEPTNYLDITSMEALEEALKNSNKTMIIVSHDRRFISKICDEVLIIDNKQLNYYPYSYNEYISKINEPTISKVDKNKEDRAMVIKNKIAETISLISIENNSEKKKEYEKNYEELLKELKVLS
ncbi:ABC-F type ribosomal protection protein [Clostridium sp. NSJ-6]|uniref:ABC-F type ribosomal protection protein n=1 Tax=Clostridium hominis TaxID=2763036 RepID=A0ABR7DHG5_9CLOT|nr:ABC-F type ribosomal protection protein [Clostridium hominis]MBC5630560.1 ABC-F type ribosomal protection protein [Clostridium hominis]MDU2672118.1 ABC-F type ribosomal protection protein [Clostridium sp.]